MTDETRNILDAMLDGMAKPKEVQRILVEQGTPFRAEALKDRLSERLARAWIREQLKKWLTTRHFHGKGTKRLLDKAISEIMCGYKGELRARLNEDANW